jgi:hypothetical protein
MDNNIKLTTEFISKADSLVTTAGTRMGVDSGLPDFCGNEGFGDSKCPLAVETQVG